MNRIKILFILYLLSSGLPNAQDTINNAKIHGFGVGLRSILPFNWFSKIILKITMGIAK